MLKEGGSCFNPAMVRCKLYALSILREILRFQSRNGKVQDNVALARVRLGLDAVFQSRNGKVQGVDNVL